MQESRISIVPNNITLLKSVARRSDVFRKLNQPFLLVDLFNFNFIVVGCPYVFNADLSA